LRTQERGSLQDCWASVIEAGILAEKYTRRPTYQGYRSLKEYNCAVAVVTGGTSETGADSLLELERQSVLCHRTLAQRRTVVQH
jgi:hypothetical protein